MKERNKKFFEQVHEFMYHHQNHLYINGVEEHPAEKSRLLTTCYTGMEDIVHALRWKIVHWKVLASPSKRRHRMDFLASHLQGYKSLKPETSKFTQSKYDINLKLVNSKCELPIIQWRSVRKVQKLTSVSKTIRAQTFLLFPSKIVSRLTFMDWLSLSMTGVTDDLSLRNRATDLHSLRMKY